MSQTRQRRHVRTKQAILDAALEIVIQDGPAALSMRALAERIDYSPAGLYEYFGSKEEIIAAVCDEGQRMLYEAMDRVNGGLPPVERLHRLCPGAPRLLPADVHRGAATRHGQHSP